MYRLLQESEEGGIDGWVLEERYILCTSGIGNLVFSLTVLSH